MTAITRRDRPVPPAAAAPLKRAHIADSERFDQRFEGSALDRCQTSEEGSGSRSLGADRREPTETESAAPHFLAAASLEGAVPDPAERPPLDGTSRSAELVELAEAIRDHLGPRGMIAVVAPGSLSTHKTAISVLADSRQQSDNAEKDA